MKCAKCERLAIVVEEEIFDAIDHTGHEFAYYCEVHAHHRLRPTNLSGKSAKHWTSTTLATTDGVMTMSEFDWFIMESDKIEARITKLGEDYYAKKAISESEYDEQRADAWGDAADVLFGLVEALKAKGL